MAVAAATRYSKHRAKMAARSREDSTAGREISGMMPGIADPLRRARACKSLRVFCETYFPKIFYCPWSEDHLTVIAALEKAVTVGTQQALAMPRGTGKTTLCKMAALWAVITGRRRSVMCIGASKPAAERITDSLSKYLLFKTLRADFPEVCYPVWHVRTAKQSRPLFNGEPINFKNNNGLIVFPTIPGSAASGAKIQCSGILSGDIRGANSTDENKEEDFRPDLVLVDDFQDDESARSPTQCIVRLKAIKSAIQGLNGPGMTLGIIAAITVITAGDAADQLLDRKSNPSWRGLRFGFINTNPIECGPEATDAEKRRVELWQRYLEIRVDELLAGGEGELATEFYSEHRAEMDHGITVRWPHRMEADKHEISAIQHAVNVIQDRDKFVLMAEYNNTPLEQSSADLRLQVNDIIRRLNRLGHRIAPDSAVRLTGFVDVHADVLYWAIIATDDAFRADVIDYGTYPEQNRRVFSKDECYRTYPKVHSDQPNLAAQLTAALHATWELMFDRVYKREDALELPLELVMTDIKWGEQRDTVIKAMKTSRYARNLLASEGEGITARKRGFEAQKLKTGERKGHGWILSPLKGVRRVRVDTNLWKSDVAGMLAVAVGAPGSCNLYGTDSEQHRNIASHWTSEEAHKRVELREVFEWELKPGRPDNHWFDCLVNAMVAASILMDGTSVGAAVVRATTHPTKWGKDQSQRRTTQTESSRSTAPPRTTPEREFPDDQERPVGVRTAAQMREQAGRKIIPRRLRPRGDDD